MSNKLSLEKSPYLLQHSHNPVYWYAWGEQAFQAARSQNKPIFLSIGYSACYWCHVMEKDSFEREEVAEILNQNFISIKVDREERPDVDQIYMEAVVALTGQGGWPMSVFLTPELKPFWGGTFFPRARFMQILEALAAAWRAESEKVLTSAQEITRHLSERTLPETSEQASFEGVFANAKSSLTERFDSRYGGFGSAPKFPPTGALALLFRIHNTSGDSSALHMAEFTLQGMAKGGMYDQVGGGFHRYSVDEKWLVPHFEKMLYDNALLSRSYLEAFQITQSAFYGRIADETVEYVLREMRAPEGGFYSAQDAGDVGREGEFYVWGAEELRQQLSPQESALAERIFQIESAGNFEGGKVVLAAREQVPVNELQSEQLSSLRQKLLALRAKRPAPSMDRKILTGWNGLMISSLAFGYQVLGKHAYLQAAQDAARFIKGAMWSSGALMRRHFDGAVGIAGCLEDYAYLIAGLIDLYESDFDQDWLLFAKDLQAAQDQHFWDMQGFGYFYSTASELIVRRKDLLDNATPAANSVAIMNLLRLGHFFPGTGLEDRAKQTLELLSPYLVQYPSAVSSALCALDFHERGSFELAAVGKSADARNRILKDIYGRFIPNRVLAACDTVESTKIPVLSGKETGYYLCRKKECLPVMTDDELALRRIKESVEAPKRCE